MRYTFNLRQLYLVTIILMVAIFSMNSNAFVLQTSIYSNKLQITKNIWVYLPPSYFYSYQKYPTIYLFRGHEYEWFDSKADPARQGNNIALIADYMMRTDAIKEAIIIGVGVTSNDGATTSLAINMQRPDLSHSYRGIGTGQFSDYIRHDLIPYVQSNFRASSNSKDRSADGFSLGGFMVHYLAIKFPGLFKSVGSYDATMMFPSLNDPAGPGENDDILWLDNQQMFQAIFGDYDEIETIANIKSSNPITIFDNLGISGRLLLAGTKFYITSASDNKAGNFLRNNIFIKHLNKFGIKNYAETQILHRQATHNWFWADYHIKKSLLFHLSVQAASKERQYN